MTSVEETRPAKVGEEVRLIFSLPTGQFAIVATVESAVGKGSAVIDFANAELLRLQRRDSFRIVVPPHITLEFYLNGKIKPEYAMRVADVSMGGMAVRMKPDQISQYWVGSSIKGALVLHGREPIELTGAIRHHFPKETLEFQKVGVQFVDIGVDEQRELLSLTLQLHREINHRA